LAHAQRGRRAGHEARLAWGVEYVDLAVLPIEGAERGGDRHLPRLLVRVGVRNGAPIGDGPQPVDRSGLVQQRLVQRCLPGPAMANKRNVADAVRWWAVSVGLHANLLARAVRAP